MRLDYFEAEEKLEKLYALEIINSLEDPWDHPHKEYEDMKT